MGLLREAFPLYRTGLGQSSHRFLTPETTKLCVIGGLQFEEVPGLSDESDGDVVFHALCNAISSLTGIPILTGIADELLQKDGITDSQVYLEAALGTLGPQKIMHVAISLEGQKPHFRPLLPLMADHVARILRIEAHQVGITAHRGDGLTDCGCGEGIAALAMITTLEMTRGVPTA